MVRNNIVAASGQGEKAFRFLTRIDNPDATLSGLRKIPAKWSSLDTKILSGVVAKATQHGELGRKLTLQIEELAKEKKMLGVFKPYS